MEKHQLLVLDAADVVPGPNALRRRAWQNQGGKTPGLGLAREIKPEKTK